MTAHGTFPGPTHVYVPDVGMCDHIPIESLEQYAFDGSTRDGITYPQGERGWATAYLPGEKRNVCAWFGEGGASS